MLVRPSVIIALSLAVSGCVRERVQESIQLRYDFRATLRAECVMLVSQALEALRAQAYVAQAKQEWDFFSELLEARSKLLNHSLPPLITAQAAHAAKQREDARRTAAGTERPRVAFEPFPIDCPTDIDFPTRAAKQ